MKLFQRLFYAAVLSGIAAGLAMATLHQWRVTPLILAAEVFETAAPAHDHGAEVVPHTHDDATVAPDHAHDEDAWAPQDGFERNGYTVLADVLASLGFALVLAAVSVIAGLEITVLNGVIWGAAAFAATALLPSFGLPPELPGMLAADLGARQLWWWATVIASAAAFLAIAKFRSPAAVGIGALLLIAPHVIGAPQFGGDHATSVPAYLATAFASATLTSSAVFWLILGPLMGWLNARFAVIEPARRGALA